MKVGDLVRINDEGALNIAERGIYTGSVGIVIKVEPDDLVKPTEIWAIYIL